MKLPATALLLLLFAPAAQAQAHLADSLPVISLQKDFEDTRRFSPAPQIRWVRTSNAGLLGELDEAALQQAVRGKNVLVLIHGMGTSFAWTMHYYRRLLHRDLPYDMIVGVVWPGGEVKNSRLANGLLFLQAGARAKKAGKKLAPLLAALSASADTLDVLTHSLGAKTGLFSLKHGPANNIDNLFLTAPAISARSLLPHKRYGFAAGRVRGKIAVFYSRNDRAFAFPAKRKMGRRGFVGAARQPGEKFINVDCSEKVLSHMDYWRSRAVSQFLER
ncbi:MAG: DUF726 domain-containing protein [Saprospirales bacterium]|nr:DUF726 domain-containing protein [Saprospirales bacterium]MBK8920559.1 DUF726 domain-containing protein [Saprospirales bacterium]